MTKLRLLVMVDLDDTLTDRRGAFAGWAVDFLARHGSSPDRVADLVRIDRRGRCPRPQFFSQLTDLLDVEFDAAAELAAYRSATAAPAPFRGTAQALGEVRASGGTIVVVSNGVGLIQRAKLANSGLEGLVDGIVISDEVGVAKPDPAIFKAAFDLSPHPAMAWMVGDYYDYDIVGAKRAGLCTAWVSHGDAAPTATPDADIVGVTPYDCFAAILMAYRAQSA